MNILGQIGNTPLLKLSKVIESPDVDIYVKCEFLILVEVSKIEWRFVWLKKLRKAAS